MLISSRLDPLGSRRSRSRGGVMRGQKAHRAYSGSIPGAAGGARRCRSAARCRKCAACGAAEHAGRG
eukprot:3082257-Prymnesium_polylepis.1